MQGFTLRDAPEFDLWQLRVREEVAGQVEWALDRLTQAESGAGRLEAAIGYARRRVALDQLNEPAHRTLMHLYARAGKRSSALRQFDVCARALRDELGQEPERETRELRDRIARGSTAGASSPPPRRTEERSYKVRLPARRAALVERSRLLDALEAATGRPLTLVSAPAGFGKTTLMAEWARGCSMPVAWLSIEERDREPARFVFGLADALQTLDSRVGDEALTMRTSIQVPPPAQMLDSLIRDLGMLRGECVLVIDDYHLVDSGQTAELFARLVSRVPPALHLVVATRSDPVVPLARMRARGELGELRADDLRFSSEDAQAFLRDVMEIELAADDVGLLEERTEGWPAGLQMAALSLKTSTDRQEQIRRFSGSHRYVMDYLVSEVLDAMPAQTVTFLLSTALLERFNADLCEAVSGIDGAQRMLEELERGNVFLVPLDDERCWYRYHHLFAELLQHRLRLSRSAEEIAAIHHHAAEWLAAEGESEAAVTHYLAAGAYSELFRLIEDRHQKILSDGGLRLLLSWMSAVPDEAISEDPMAATLTGVFQAFAGDAAAAERWFAAGEPEGDTPRAREIRGIAAALRAFLNDLAGRTADVISQAERADQLLTTEEAMTRALIPYVLSRAYRLQGDLERADRHVEEHIAYARAAHNLWILSGAIHEKVLIRRLRGELRDAERILDEFHASCGDAEPSGPIAKTIAARADLWAETARAECGEIEHAAATANRAVIAVTPWGLPSDVCFCLQTRIRVSLCFGDLPAAEKDLARVEEIIRSTAVYSSIIPRHQIQRARLMLARSELPAATDWLTRYRYPDSGNPVDREAVEITRARVLLAAGRSSEALELLDALASAAETGGRRGRLIEILVLTALATGGSGCAEHEWQAPLRRALEIGEPEGYRALFVAEGDPLRTLIGALIEHAGDLPATLREYALGLIL